MRRVIRSTENRTDRVGSRTLIPHMTPSLMIWIVGVGSRRKWKRCDSSDSVELMTPLMTLIWICALMIHTLTLSLLKTALMLFTVKSLSSD